MKFQQKVLMILEDAYFEVKNATAFVGPDEVYVDKELLLLIHYLFWVYTCEGSYSNQILWETEELLLPAGRKEEAT